MTGHNDRPDELANVPAPTRAALDWSPPTSEIELYTGQLALIRGGTMSPPATGVLRLLLRDHSSLTWRAAWGNDLESFQAWRFRTSDDDPPQIVLLDHPDQLKLPTRLTSDGKGSITSRPPLNPETAITSITAVWHALPEFPGTQQIGDTNERGRWQRRHGRTTVHLGEWVLTLDARPDLSDVLREASEEHLPVGTHAMELRLSSGGAFSESQARDVLDGLTLGMSFALDRWAAPLRPVGVDHDGHEVWSEWLPVRVDQPGRGSGRWWEHLRPKDLWQFLDLWLKLWLKEEGRHILRFVAASSVAGGEHAFLEQRIMTKLAAVELLSWAVEVLPNPAQEEKWSRNSADWRLRRLLTRAEIPIALGAATLPGFSRYLDAQAGIDCPKALMLVRHSLTHPKRTLDLYAQERLLVDASLLAGRYLDLLLLWYVGYNGHFRDRTRLDLWSGQSEPVPWHVSTDVNGEG